MVVMSPKTKKEAYKLTCFVIRTSVKDSTLTCSSPSLGATDVEFFLV